MMDSGRPSLCLAIPVGDDRESDALQAGRSTRLWPQRIHPSPEILVQVPADDRGFSLKSSTTPARRRGSFELDEGIYPP